MPTVLPPPPSPSQLTSLDMLLIQSRFVRALVVASLAACSWAGGADTESLPYNFTIAAVNTTLPNSNTTGVPLVLGQNGASTGISFYVTSTYASYPYNDYPSLGLVDGSLRAFVKSGEWITNATEPSNGGTLGWVTSRIYKGLAPQIYSASRVPAEKFPLLAVHGITSLWSLCPFRGFRGQTNVVFNVSADVSPPPSLGFDPADCYSVKLNIVPLPVN